MREIPTRNSQHTVSHGHRGKEKGPSQAQPFTLIVKAIANELQGKLVTHVHPVLWSGAVASVSPIK